MTETPTQQDPQPGPGPHSGSTGLDREGLRDFERLRRSTTDRKIAGVAGGLGRHLNIDPTILRVLFVVLVFFGGAGLLLYGAAWLIVPEEGSDEAPISTSPGTRNAVLVVVGILAALLLIGDSWGGFGFPWPLAIIALVVALVLVNRDRPRSPKSGPPSGVSTGSTGWVSAGSTTGTGTTTATGWVGDDTTGQASGYDGTSGPSDGPPTWGPAPAAPAPRPSKRDRGPKLFGFTLAAIALALGVLGLVDASGGTVVDAAYPAVALTLVGVMLVVGAWVGRPGGLILLGVIAALALAVSSAVGEEWNGERRLVRTPLSAQTVADDYSLTAGEIDLDLTEVTDPENLDGRTIELRAEAGEILVAVPDDMDVVVNGDIRWGGEIEIDGLSRGGGGGVDMTRTIDGGTNVPTLTLDIDLTVGHIEVVQEEAA